MLDKLHQKRAVLVAQDQQLSASLNQLVNQVNMTRGAIAIIDELIGEAQAEQAAQQQAAAVVSEQSQECDDQRLPVNGKDVDMESEVAEAVPPAIFAQAAE